MLGSLKLAQKVSPLPLQGGPLLLALARVDHTLEKTFRSFLSPDLLILDDLGLRRLSPQQSADLYELIIGRHRRASFIITSNRAVEVLRRGVFPSKKALVKAIMDYIDKFNREGRTFRWTKTAEAIISSANSLTPH